MEESRQVRRANERALKKGGLPSTHEVYYIELERKSRAGVVYKYYKKVVDLIGLKSKNNDRPTIEDIINKGESEC